MMNRLGNNVADYVWLNIQINLASHFPIQLITQTSISILITFCVFASEWRLFFWQISISIRFRVIVFFFFLDFSPQSIFLHFHTQKPRASVVVKPISLCLFSYYYFGWRESFTNMSYMIFNLLTRNWDERKRLAIKLLFVMIWNASTECVLAFLLCCKSSWVERLDWIVDGPEAE